MSFACLSPGDGRQARFVVRNFLVGSATYGRIARKFAHAAKTFKYRSTKDTKGLDFSDFLLLFFVLKLFFFVIFACLVLWQTGVLRRGYFSKGNPEK